MDSAAMDSRSLQSLMEELYEFSIVGGPLHIATDDGNLQDSHLDFCERDIEGHWSIRGSVAGDAERMVPVCREIIRRLRAMPYAERRAKWEASSW